MRLRHVLASISLAAASFMVFTTGSGGSPASGLAFLAGGDTGLYRVREDETGLIKTPVWTEGSVRKLIPAYPGWYALSSRGILWISQDGAVDPVSGGSGRKTLLLRSATGAFSPAGVAEELRDIASDPSSPGRMAACTSTEVRLRFSQGEQWESLGSPTQVPGLKAIAFAPYPGTGVPAIWASHAYKGVFARALEKGGKWNAFIEGLPKVHGTAFEEAAEFVSSIDDRSGAVRLFTGMSFLGRVLEWDARSSQWITIHDDKKDFGTIASLSRLLGGNLGFLDRDGFAMLREDKPAVDGKPGIWSIHRDSATTDLLCKIGTTIPGLLTAAKYPETGILQPPSPPQSISSSFHELWLLDSPDPGEAGRRARQAANGRTGLYLQTNFLTDPKTREKYFTLAKNKGLDSIVLDIKDDSGRLRFTPRSLLVARLGKVRDPLDLESFLEQAKRRGLYIVGRIVVFKDEALYSADNGAYAVKDARSGGRWQGRRSVGGISQPIQEHWVDPYSPSVWDYNVEIAKEILDRGFDEVQFDYIRFPTDGDNLDDARFPASLPGMDRQSALESFLAYARSSIDAPISLDIYGANGWYRSGVRTGQDVEMLSRYVDVICPMYYPSHFEQGFLGEPPRELRPWRIYRLGTLRARHIARDRVLVRPYVQAFFLDVEYDREWYGKPYVEQERRGVEEGAGEGLTYWNNSGRYDDIP